MEFDNMSYEEAIEKLEQIINALEEGDLPLEDALNNFRKGMELYKHCFNILNKVEGEIKTVMEDGETNTLEEDL